MTSGDGLRHPGPGRAVWADRDFRLLWSGQATAQVGGQVGQFVLPLLVLQLGAGAGTVGLLRAASLLPHLLFSLPAGHLADRTEVRPLMMWADWIRCLTMLTVMLLASLHMLTVWQLLVAVMVLGVCTVIFDISYYSLLPGMLLREQLGTANFALEAARSFATLAGPALAGLLLGLLPLWAALTVDAAALAVSAATLMAMRRGRPAVSGARSGPVDTGKRALAAGWLQVWHSPVLRPSMLYLGFRNLFAGIFSTYVLVFQVRELGFSVTRAAMVELLGNGGFLLGVLVGGWVSRRMGIGPQLCGGALLSALGIAVVSLARGDAAMAMTVGGLIAYGLGVASSNLQNVVLRQAVTPPEVMGRVSAVLRLAAYGTLPAGAALGALTTSLWGLRPSLQFAAVGALLTTAILVFSGIRTIRALPPTEPLSIAGPPLVPAPAAGDIPSPPSASS
ncbi:MFS transporter [Streptomyces sp. NPDC005576]|uniref:MFS transporter n=1 Tax=Streptomyces sp. NPDC005576 TaxID=3364726 RepID=UPI0036BB469D